MTAVDLLEPILSNGLARNNFFNGRLLSAEDLSAEQSANRLQQSRLARVIGHGIGAGLGVTVLSTKPAVVRIGKGTALNGLGNLLSLATDADVTLVPTSKPSDTGTGIFGDCDVSSVVSTGSGIGAFVLVIAPASGYSGTALVSDQNVTSAGRGACGAKLTVEGVRFRLVALPLGDLAGLAEPLRTAAKDLLATPLADSAPRERLRNLLAHLCFGTASLDGFFADPREVVTGTRRWAGWGLIDALLAHGDLTCCDVPLALVVLTGAGISFVDVWSVRRKLVDSAAIDTWRPVAGPRRVAEGEAAFLQFQAQLDTVRAAAPNAATVAAGTYFQFLPPSGWLPGGGVEGPGFDWTVFLQQHAPPAATLVDAALLRGIVERSWLDEPFSVATQPPVPVQVFRVPETPFVVFARSRRGNIRVTLDPVPASPTVSATANTGATTQATTRNGNTLPIVELMPGSYTVNAGATGYVDSHATNISVVGGRTVDVALTMTPLPNGSLLVDPIDRTTNARITTAVTAVTASAGGVTKSGTRHTDGRWLIEDLPAATYTLTGVASGYTPATGTAPAPTAPGTQINAVLLFDLQTAPPQKPSTCITIQNLIKPPLGKVKLCLVLVATEFEESYFYRNVARLAEAGGAMYKALRMDKRSEESTRKQQSARYTTTTGEILFTQNPWKKMELLDPEPADVTQWLVEWRDWLATQLRDESIRAVRARLYLDPKYTPPKSTTQVPERPPGYAVFNHLAIPVSIQPFAKITLLPVPIDEAKIPGLPKYVIDRLYEVDIRYLNDLGWGWRELVLDATGGDVDPTYLVVDAQRRVEQINDTKSYIEGMTTDVQQKLNDHGINDNVALANMDAHTLGGYLADEGLASRLISQARRIVPRESWALDTLALSDREVMDFERQGIDSMGALTRATETDAGKTAIVNNLGLGAEPAETQAAALNNMTNDAVAAMTEQSVALIPEKSVLDIKGVDTATALKFSAAGLTTASDIQRAGVNGVAAAGNITIEAAQAIVADATAVSRTATDASVLAPVTTQEKAALDQLFAGSGGKATLGGLLTKTPAELAGALGSAGRAGALINGINAALGAKGMR